MHTKAIYCKKNRTKLTKITYLVLNFKQTIANFDWNVLDELEIFPSEIKYCKENFIQVETALFCFQNLRVKSRPLESEKQKSPY
jgi:hypothetical protein